MNKGGQLAIALLTVFGGLAWLLNSQSGSDGTFRYYENVSSFARTGVSGSQSGDQMRVHGFVVEGSIAQDIPAGHVDFAIQDKADAEHPLLVRLAGIELPDMFKDGAEVVVEGRFEQGRFRANRVMAKCPSKYEAKPDSTARTYDGPRRVVRLSSRGRV